MSSQHLQIRTNTGFSAAIGHLENLIDCLRRGTIYITHKGKTILLKPRTEIGIELEAESKPDHSTYKEKIALKLHWEITESWLRGREFFSIAQPDTADDAPGDLPIFIYKPSDESGGKEREKDNREDTSDTFILSLRQEATRMASQHFKVKSKATLVEVINHLEQLVTSLKEGQLYIRKNDKVITLKPHDPVTFELEAEAKLEKDSLCEKLTIELKWKKGESAVNDSFTITHLEPTSEY